MQLNENKWEKAWTDEAEISIRGIMNVDDEKMQKTRKRNEKKNGERNLTERKKKKTRKKE